MDGFLRQATASQSRVIGPFIDDADFKTPETGLTIANTDIKLVINGAASADKNSGGGTHRANGKYSITFDATDTATVGEVSVSVLVSGALLVWHKFVVLEEAVYDAMFAASAPGDSAGVTTLLSRLSSARAGYLDNINNAGLATTVAQTGDAYARVGANGAGLTALPWNAAWDAEVQSECTDALNAYDPPTYAEMASLPLGGGGGGPITQTEFTVTSGNTSAPQFIESVPATITVLPGSGATALVQVSTASEADITAHYNAGAWNGTAVDWFDWTPGSVTEDTYDSITSPVVGLRVTATGGSVDAQLVQAEAATGTGASAADIADAVLDEALSGHTTAGTLGKAVADILVDTAEIGAAGAGLTAINLPDQTMNITGNLSGSVGSVTGAVGSVTGNVGGSVASVTGLTASDVGAIKAVADKLDDTLEDDAGTYRFTVNALEQAPAGGGGGGGIADGDEMSYTNIPQSTAYEVVFRAKLTADGEPATGKTIPITISKDGGETFANPAAGATNATEGVDGWYRFTLGIADTNTAGPLVWQGSESTIADVGGVFIVVSSVSPQDLADALLETPVPGTFTAGTVGYIIGTNLNATVSSRASQTSVDDVPTNAELSTALGTSDDAVLAAVAALNDLSSAEVQTAANAALVANHLDHLLAADYDPAAKPGVATALLNELVESDSGVSRFSANTLETAPTGTGEGGAGLDAAGVRAAIGLAAANLDAQLLGIQTDADAILADTSELQTDWTNGGRLDLILDSRSSQTSVDGVPTNAELDTALELALSGIEASIDATAVADAILGRNIAGGSSSGRTVSQALAFMRNRWSIVGGVLTVYATDDTTPLWIGSVTQTAGDPVTESDPA
jgi:hypothetical protein